MTRECGMLVNPLTEHVIFIFFKSYAQKAYVNAFCEGKNLGFGATCDVNLIGG